MKQLCIWIELFNTQSFLVDAKMRYEWSHAKPRDSLHLLLALPLLMHTFLNQIMIILDKMLLELNSRINFYPQLDETLFRFVWISHSAITNYINQKQDLKFFALLIAWMRLKDLSLCCVSKSLSDDIPHANKYACSFVRTIIVLPLFCFINILCIFFNFLRSLSQWAYQQSHLTRCIFQPL